MREARFSDDEAKWIPLNELEKKFNLKHDYLVSKIEELIKEGVIEKKVESKEIVYPDERILEGRLPPEITLLRILEDKSFIELNKLREEAQIPEDDFNAGLSILIKSKLIEIIKKNGKRLIRIKNLNKKRNILLAEDVLRKIREYGRIEFDKLTNEEKEVVERLLKRPGYLKKAVEKKIYVHPLIKEEDLMNKLTAYEEITQLTPRIIKEKKWISKKFKKYDLNLSTFKLYPGKIHPLRELIREVREVFISLGFREEIGPLIEVAFINFDMLFQPQDHPAREMQDTFYIREPKYGEIPYSDLINRVKATHENGWRTGSIGWRYKWSLKEAKRLVLRTHTTSVTVKALYETGEKPDKIFTIGSVFRNETVDYKHLVEFMQIDGIVIHPKANLRWLMGIIEYFYRRMGFKKIKFWPSYFPYTEPSIQPSIYVEKWRKWLELGGAGIFRPEVTLPLDVRWPVLAWGLGLERLLMIKYDLDDIRTIYRNDIGWLRKVSLIL